MLDLIKTSLGSNSHEHFAHLKVLIVDGNKRRRSVVEGMLRAAGVLEVNHAVNAVDGLSESFMRRPDVIILEYGLKGLDGMQFAATLRRSDRPDRYTRLILLGEGADLKQCPELRDCGIDAFLVRPMMARDLLETLRRVSLHGRDFVETADYFGPDRRREPRESNAGLPPALAALVIAAAA